MYRALKIQKYFLFLGYLKLIVSCLFGQKENTKQREIFHLVDHRTKQRELSFEF